MDIKKFDKKIIHDDAAIWQLGNFIYIKLESIQEQIDAAEEDQYLFRDGKIYRCGTDRFKEELSKLKIQLEFVKNIVAMSDKTHKYLID